MKALKKYKISVFGETYTVVSDESEEQVMNTAQYVDDLMRHTASKFDIYDSKRIAALVSLQLASRLKDLEEKCALHSQKEHELADRIDRELSSFGL